MEVHQRDKIHGKDDVCFENAISKLLDYGFTKSHPDFDRQFRYLLEESFWKGDEFLQIVVYPFLMRAGYADNEGLMAFFLTRLDRIVKAIDKYEYDFQDRSPILNRKYRDEFRLITDRIFEPLPSIYDIYAYSYYLPENCRPQIERIVEYVLDERFQAIPANAYVYDKLRKRYYGAGSVYHACLREDRKLLNILLFSNFKAIGNHPRLLHEIRVLLNSRLASGFYQFDKSWLKEVKNGNHVYTGAHMGLGESKGNPDRLKIESTFLMLKIIANLYQNDILVEGWRE